ncbi:MAG: hypothetical protein JNL67_02620 [Planctomycetaceae bacterium]|nr:hypothetical protein [Planctomycetaceae bacterium]
MTPSNLAIVGLATGLLGQIGQSAADTAKTVTNAALAPFAALLQQDSETTNDADSSSDVSNAKRETATKFGTLYDAFEQQIQGILSNYPDLPKIRVQISNDAQIRLSAVEPNELSPESAKLLAGIQETLNRDHQIGDIANQLYQSKSLDHWRRGSNGAAGDVELIVNPS